MYRSISPSLYAPGVSYVNVSKFLIVLKFLVSEKSLQLNVVLLETVLPEFVPVLFSLVPVCT